MPRLKQTDTEKKNIAIRQLIKLYQIERGNKNGSELAELMKCSKTTLYKRLKNPGTLTVEELRRLKACLNIPTETMTEYLGRAL